jgi:hypothetical protein
MQKSHLRQDLTRINRPLAHNDKADVRITPAASSRPYFTRTRKLIRHNRGISHLLEGVRTRLPRHATTRGGGR